MHEGPPAPGVATPSEKVAQRVLRETGHFALWQLLGAGVGWGAHVALARLLSQRDFGVFGICSFYIGIGQLLGDGGLGATLLRRKGAVTDDEYRVTVSSLLCVACVFALGLWVAAPMIAARNAFSSSELWALRSMVPLYFVGALRIAPYVRLERELRFSVIARIELGGQLARHLVSLAVAGLYSGPWALLCGQIAGCSLQLLAAYRYSPGWVGLGFSLSVFRPLISYGIRVQALTLCAYFKDNLSRALLGSLLGPAAVGSYDFAIGYIQLPVVAVNALARVQMPVYAQLTRQDPALFAALRGTIRSTLLLGLPCLGALLIAAPWLIPSVYGPKWSGTTPVAWGLLINMVCSLGLSPLFTLLSAQGRAGLALGVFVIWTSATWGFALAASWLQPEALAAIALGQSLASLGVTAFLLHWVGRYLRQNLLPALWRLLFAFGLALGCTLLASASAQIHPLPCALGFVALYAGLLWLLERELLRRELRALFVAVTRAG